MLFYVLVYDKNNNKKERSLFKIANWLLNMFLKLTEVSERDRNKINSDP